jgi:hypothetical protein
LESLNNIYQKKHASLQRLAFLLVLNYILLQKIKILLYKKPAAWAVGFSDECKYTQGVGGIGKPH